MPSIGKLPDLSGCQDLSVSPPSRSMKKQNARRKLDLTLARKAQSLMMCSRWFAGWLKHPLTAPDGYLKSFYRVTAFGTSNTFDKRSICDAAVYRSARKCAAVPLPLTFTRKPSCRAMLAQAAAMCGGRIDYR